MYARRTDTNTALSENTDVPGSRAEEIRQRVARFTVPKASPFQKSSEKRQLSKNDLPFIAEADRKSVV